MRIYYYRRATLRHCLLADELAAKACQENAAYKKVRLIQMKKHLRSARIYLEQHWQGFLTVVFACLLLLAVGGLIMAFVAMATPRVVYEPQNACDMLTAQDAAGLLGESAIQTSNEAASVSQNTAVSKCGYTDGNHDTEQMIVAAVIVRSGINDDGVLENKRDFVKSQPRGRTDIVQGVGDAAYFNTTNGQLNVLDGRNWIILSYGLGADPAANTREQALKLAAVVVPGSAGSVPSF